MRLKYYGGTLFKIDTGQVAVATDPVFMAEEEIEFSPLTVDIALISDPTKIGQDNFLKEYQIKSKVSPSKGRKKVYEISNPGEYEIGGLIIRRLDEQGVYILDDGYIRLVYVGVTRSDKLDLKMFGKLGDVDVLIIPVADGENFPGYKNLEKLVNKVDPMYLLPAVYNDESLEKFLKECGYSKPEEKKSKLKVANAPEKDEREMEVVLLKE